jgi:hypothetical protein
MFVIWLCGDSDSGDVVVTNNRTRIVVVVVFDVVAVFVSAFVGDGGRRCVFAHIRLHVFIR